MLRRSSRLPELPDDIEQSDQPTQHMQRMRGRQHIEERTAGIGGEIKPFGPQLAPGDILAGDKEQAEDQRDIEPACGTFARGRDRLP